MHVDYCLVRGLIALYGCEPLSSERTRQATSDYARLADVPAADPVVRGIFEYGSCIAHNLKAEFDVALEWGARARQRVRRRSRYLTMLIDFQLGQVAMAQVEFRTRRSCIGEDGRSRGTIFRASPTRRHSAAC